MPSDNWRDAQGRFRLIARGWQDVRTRFRLGVRAFKDAATRFRVAPLAYRDTASRFRLILPRYKDVATRYKVRITGARLRAWNGSVWVMPKKAQSYAGSWAGTAWKAWGGEYWLMALENDRWSDLAPLPVERSQAATAEVLGKLYVVGGRSNTESRTDTVYSYDPTTDVWTAKADYPITIRNAAAFSLNNKLYVTGGSEADEDSGLTTKMYDPGLDTWTNKANFSGQREQHAACAVGGKGYIIGGFNDDTDAYKNDVQEYDPVGNTWTTKTGAAMEEDFFGVPVAVGRRGLQAVAHKTTVFILGGQRSSEAAMTQVYEMNPSGTGSLTEKAVLPAGRFNHGAALSNGAIFVAGGHQVDTDDLKATMYRYDISRNIWQTLGNMPFSRSRFGLVNYRGLLYAIGGQYDSETDDNITNLTLFGE